MTRPPLRTLGLTERPKRGVYIAQWMGPNGEFELLAFTSERKLATGVPVRIPLGADHGKASDDLWDMLDVIDPPRPILSVIRADDPSPPPSSPD